MNSILYAASIGTFATWLGFSGASTVGIFVPGRPQVLPELKRTDMPAIVITDGEYMEVDMFAGGSAQASEVDSQDNTEEIFNQEAATPEVAEVLPDIPEVPEVTTEPLPEIPELPESAPKPELKPSQDTFAVAKQKPAAPKASVKRSETRKNGTDRPVAKRTQTGTGTGSGSSGTSGSGAGTSGFAAKSGGSKPRPTYPPAAQKQGIEGTVTVSITFTEEGRVANCSIIRSSHPLLHNDIILNNIRRWKVPGLRGTHAQTVRFTLN